MLAICPQCQILHRFGSSDGASGASAVAAGSTIADYVNGLGIDNKLRETIGGTTDYFLTDRLGTTRAFADSNGSVSTSLTYDSLGNPITGSFSSRFTYIGREQDGDTG